MKFYQKRGFALVVLVLAILGSCVYGISKKPADLPQVSYGNWLQDDADLLTDETEASLRQYDQSWDSDYRAIIAVATLDTLNGWTYEKAAAELGSRWGLGGNDMLLLLVKDSDCYVALGDNVLNAMTDTYQAGLQGAVEAPYYQGDYDAAALAFFRQADVFYAQTGIVGNQRKDRAVRMIVPVGDSFTVTQRDPAQSTTRASRATLHFPAVCRGLRQGDA